MTIITDDEIGFYDLEKSTNFADRTSLNLFFDTVIIVLLGICISFSYKIYYNVKYMKGKNYNNKNYNNNQVVQIVQVNAVNQPGFIMVDQNGQYIYAQPIGNNPNIVYQQNQFRQGNNNNRSSRNNYIQNDNNNDVNEKYNY